MYECVTTRVNCLFPKRDFYDIRQRKRVKTHRQGYKPKVTLPEQKVERIIITR